MKYSLNELSNKISLEDSQEQFLDEISIKRLTSYVKIKLESEIAKHLDDTNLDDRLGVFTQQFLNRLPTIKIQGNYWLNPINFKNDTQKKGTTSFDVSKYKQHQIIPFILMNSKNEILKGGKKPDQFYLVLNIPAIGAQIDDKNIDEFKKLFKLPKNFGNDNFKSLMSFNNIDLHCIKIKHDELKSIDKMFLANNKTQINRIDIQSKSALRKSTAKKENPGEISDENDELQTNEIKLNYHNIINEKMEINMKYIQKQKLSNLLFENSDVQNGQTTSNSSSDHDTEIYAVKWSELVASINDVDTKFYFKDQSVHNIQQENSGCLFLNDSFCCIRSGDAKNIQYYYKKNEKYEKLGKEISLQNDTNKEVKFYNEVYFYLNIVKNLKGIVGYTGRFSYFMNLVDKNLPSQIDQATWEQLKNSINGDNKWNFNDQYDYIIFINNKFLCTKKGNNIYTFFFMCDDGDFRRFGKEISEQDDKYSDELQFIDYLNRNLPVEGYVGPLEERQNKTSKSDDVEKSDFQNRIIEKIKDVISRAVSEYNS